MVSFLKLPNGSPLFARSVGIIFGDGVLDVVLVQAELAQA